MGVKSPERAATPLTTKVKLDDTEVELLFATQFVYNLDENDVAAWALTWLFDWLRKDERVQRVIEARQKALDELGAEPRADEAYGARAMEDLDT